MDSESIENFYTLIRTYFAQKAEEERVVISPLFGQKANIVVSGNVYFEIMNGRIFNVDCVSAEEGADFFVSDFTVAGRVCDMLTLRTVCNVDKLSALWCARRRWIEAAIEPEALL